MCSFPEAQTCSRIPHYWLSSLPLLVLPLSTTTCHCCGITHLIGHHTVLVAFSLLRISARRGHTEISPHRVGRNSLRGSSPSVLRCCCCCCCCCCYCCCCCCFERRTTHAISTLQVQFPVAFSHAMRLECPEGLLVHYGTPFHVAGGILRPIHGE